MEEMFGIFATIVTIVACVVFVMQSMKIKKTNKKLSFLNYYIWLICGIIPTLDIYLFDRPDLAMISFGGLCLFVLYLAVSLKYRKNTN